MVYFDGLEYDFYLTLLDITENNVNNKPRLKSRYLREFLNLRKDIFVKSIINLLLLYNLFIIQNTLKSVPTQLASQSRNKHKK